MAAVVTSLDELLDGATERQPLKTSDSKSGASFERVVVDGRPHIVKYLHPDDDWIMRVTGDLVCRPAVVWRSGLLDNLPASIDHAMVGVATGLGRNQWGIALLMRDVSEWLVPEGDAPVSLAQHLSFMDHMAQLHASMWGWRDDVGLMPASHRYCYFSEANMALERAREPEGTVPHIATAGWARFAERSSIATEILELRARPWPLVRALGRLPQTFLHGDWKMGNLGSGPDGRTVLLDWATPGPGVCTSELMWYVAINRARLPHSKEDTIEAYRAALERAGIDTSEWWEQAVGLALIGALVQFGWEKALGDADELAWWERGARRHLGFL